MAEETKKIAIVGAGLSGLTTAYYLAKAGIEVQVFEKDKHIGGVIRTMHKNGFTYECGPNTGVLSGPEAVELFESLNGLCELEVADSNAKFRWIWKGHQWQPLPSGLISAVTTPLFSWYDKFRILGEPFRKPGTNPDENLASLVKRRLGKSFLDYAVDPFILGIYSGDPEYLIPKYALPKLYNLEQNYGSFIKGSIKKKKEPKDERMQKATREIFSVKGGLSKLIDALVHEIGSERIHTGCENIQVKQDGNQYAIVFGSNVADGFTHVVNTAGSYALNTLFPFVNTDELNVIDRLKYARVAQVSIGFKQWKGIDLKAFGGLVPSKENKDILGVLFLSSFLKDRAPKEGALLSIFLGGMRKSHLVDLSDDEIIDIIRNSVKEMMKIDQFNPDLLEIHRYEHAIPQYGIDSKDKLEAIASIEKQYPGLFLAGNIRDGIGMADRIKQGRLVAEEIINQNS
ncbi:MAG: protoporphyrinogen oxidase [Bacteroidota bacterium]|nr:protoporphyrinogen oxidase [Bacteroidota bacterium]